VLQPQAGLSLWRLCVCECLAGLLNQLA